MANLYLKSNLFCWSYYDKEICLLLEGEVTITLDGGEPVKFGKGDLVVFPAGMQCKWMFISSPQTLLFCLLNYVHT